jgi:hypothetical protein
MRLFILLLFCFACSSTEPAKVLPVPTTTSVPAASVKPPELSHYEECVKEHGGESQWGKCPCACAESGPPVCAPCLDRSEKLVPKKVVEPSSKSSGHSK